MAKPTDFALTYEWQEGSIPPPYHYEYTIHLGPGSGGEIRFRPDYAFNNPPVWVEKLDVSSEKLTELYTLMAQEAVLSRQWQPAKSASIGGKTEWVEGTVSGGRFAVPYPLEASDAQTMAEVYQRIQSFVPTSVWTKLMKQRTEYIQTFLANQK